MSTSDRAPALTARETEIVRLLADGLTARSTARELRLSVKTVEAHKLNVMRKLGVHKRSELLRYAEQNGLVQPAPAA
jgi:DNA-binding CsgD family transcriptional regulator